MNRANYVCVSYDEPELKLTATAVAVAVVVK